MWIKSSFVVRVAEGVLDLADHSGNLATPMR